MIFRRKRSRDHVRKFAVEIYEPNGAGARFKLMGDYKYSPHVLVLFLGPSFSPLTITGYAPLIPSQLSSNT